MPIQNDQVVDVMQTFINQQLSDILAQNSKRMNALKDPVLDLQLHLKSLQTPIAFQKNEHDWKSQSVSIHPARASTPASNRAKVTLHIAYVALGTLAISPIAYYGVKLYKEYYADKIEERKAKKRDEEIQAARIAEYKDPANWEGKPYPPWEEA